jgi:O-antigen/teichoic acid export membrane protein
MAVAFGVNLPGIALLLVIATAAASSAYLMLCRQAFPDVRLRAGFEKMAARRLVAYGKWVTVSNLLAPLLVYADRFLIAAFVSASAVTYYVAPYEVATRLWVIPASLVAVLFPRFAVFTDPDIASVRRVFVQAIKYLLLFMIPLVAVLTAGAVPLLRAWLGESFARESSLGLQILAVGVLINSIGQVPFALIQGLGRPDVVAKLYLAEVGFYLVLASLLIQRYGIPGAAAAWTIRAAVDAFLLLAVAFKLSPIGWHSLLEHGMPRVLAGNAAILAICAVVPAAVSRAETPVGALAAGVFAGLLAVAIWLAMFNRNDRERFRQLAVDSFRRREIA